jgi:hypothetical protein
MYIMNAGKAVAIILLTLFVFAMPLAVFISNFGEVVYNQEKVQDILVSSAFSDQALPFRIKELVMAQAQSGDWGPGVDLDTLTTSLDSIDDQQWVVLFDTVMPENARVAMVERLIGAIYGWLDNAADYPEIILSFGPLFSNLQTHGIEIINWAINSMDGPPCTGEQIAKYETEKYGDDLLTLVSCQPREDLRDGVTAHAADLLPSLDSGGVTNGEINLTEQLQSSVGKEVVKTTKTLARRMRLVLPLMWLIPVFLFVVAIALTISTLKEFYRWARWPLIAAGALGILLALLIMNPAGVLAQALPAAGKIPALTAALITSLLDGLLNQVGRSMLWQMVVILVVGIVLLALSFIGTGKKTDPKPAEVVPVSTEGVEKNDLADNDG